jgi:hypothetical protein
MKSPEIAMEQFELEPSHYPGSNHSSPHTEYSNLSPPLPVSSSASSASSESETSRTVSIHSRPSSPSRIQPSPCGATSGSPCCEVCSEQMTTPTEGSDVLPPEYPVSRPPEEKLYYCKCTDLIVHFQESDDYDEVDDNDHRSVNFFSVKKNLYYYYLQDLIIHYFVTPPSRTTTRSTTPTTMFQTPTTR